MKRIKIIVLTLLSVFCSSPIFAESYKVEVGQFQKLKINGDITVIYKNLPDSTGFAAYRAEPGSDAVFTFSTKGDGTLKIEPNYNKWGKKDLPLLYLYSDFLTSVDNNSNESVIVESVAPCATFNVNQVGNGIVSVDNVKCNNVTAAITTGNGSIYISGKCLNANFRMVGTGLISADRLCAENVKCRILGTGSIGCWPVDNLNITGLGSTKIYYKGKPNIKKTGGGKLFELPDEIDQQDYTKIGTPVNSIELPESLAPSTPEDDHYQTVVTNDD